MRKKWRHKLKPLQRRNLSSAKDRLRFQCKKKNKDLEVFTSRDMRRRLLANPILRSPHKEPEDETVEQSHVFFDDPGPTSNYIGTGSRTEDLRSQASRHQTTGTAVYNNSD